MGNIKSNLGAIYKIIKQFGFDPIRSFNFLKNLPRFFFDYLYFRKETSIDFPIKGIIPYLHEKNDNAGTSSGHYFHQDLFVAQRIYLINPEKHIDIGSSIYGFVSHVAVFRKITIIDVRNFPESDNNISFLRMDLSNDVEEIYHNFVDSISSLHAIEHFGLGRYGDKLSVDGYKNAINNVYKILKPGGIFHFSVPIGPQRIEFNAHRVFAIKTLINLFNCKFSVLNFSYIDDKGDLHKFVGFEDNELIESNFGCFYGCGIFELKKI